MLITDNDDFIVGCTNTSALYIIYASDSWLTSVITEKGHKKLLRILSCQIESLAALKKTYQFFPLWLHVQSIPIIVLSQNISAY